MNRPQAGITADAIYGGLGRTIARGDEDADWPILTAIEAGYRRASIAEALVTDQPGRAAWHALGDVWATPDPANLGQWVGLTPRPELTDAEQRQRIIDRPEWKVGTPAYFEAVAREYLTGGRRVELYARTGPPGREYERAQVRIFRHQLPDGNEPRLRAALASAKGLIALDVLIANGRNYLQIRDSYPTYAAARAALPTYADQMYLLPEDEE